ncbi:MAG: FadR/GntR family transcriptional regulator [Solirubrobacterales bacterium]
MNRADAVNAVFEPVRRPTTFDETIDRLTRAIKVGLLEPESQLPPERTLACQLAISRSTLRAALTELVSTGYLVAQRGRRGGTFVAQAPPMADPTPLPWATVQDQLAYRLGVELGAVTLAIRRTEPGVFDVLEEPIAEMDRVQSCEEFRRADIEFHLGVAQASGSRRLVEGMTESQERMSDLLCQLPHEIRRQSNESHRALVEAMRTQDLDTALAVTREHIRGTELLFADLYPELRAAPEQGFPRVSAA